MSSELCLLEVSKAYWCAFDCLSSVTIFSYHARDILNAAVNYVCAFWINSLWSKCAQHLLIFIYVNLVSNSSMLLIINVESKKFLVSSIYLCKSIIRNIVQVYECIVSKIFEVHQIMSQIVAIQVSIYLVALLVIILCTCVISNQKDLWFKKHSHVV